MYMHIYIYVLCKPDAGRPVPCLLPVYATATLHTYKSVMCHI